MPLRKCSSHSSNSGNSSNCQFAVIAICVNTKANKTLSSLSDDQCQLQRQGTKELSNELAKIDTKLLPGSHAIDLFILFLFFPLCLECVSMSDQNTHTRILCGLAVWEHWLLALDQKTIA